MSLTMSQHEQIRRLPQFWMRMSFCLYFPEAFTPEQFDALLKEARRYKPELAAAQVESAVKLLNDESFRKREAATAQLLSYGERAIPILERLYKKSSSSEVENRLSNLMSTLRNLGPDHAEAGFVSAARSMMGRTDHAILLLQALSKNSSDAHITTLATGALKESKK